jgi:hypothetical protein
MKKMYSKYPISVCSKYKLSSNSIAKDCLALQMARIFYRGGFPRVPRTWICSFRDGSCSWSRTSDENAGQTIVSIARNPRRGSRVRRTRDLHQVSGCSTGRLAIWPRVHCIPPAAWYRRTKIHYRRICGWTTPFGIPNCSNNVGCHA